MYCPHEFSPHSHSTSYYSTMKIIGPSASISRHVPSACTLNMNSRPLICLLRIPLPVPLPQDCGDACAASGECALLRGSKLLVFAEANEPMDRINLDDEVRGCAREGVALGLGHCVRVNGDAFKIKNGADSTNLPSGREPCPHDPTGSLSGRGPRRV